MTWILVSRGFWRTPCGRFDKLEVMEIAAEEYISHCPPSYVGVDKLTKTTRTAKRSKTYYVVIDFDYGVCLRTFSVQEADSWAKERAEKFKAALTPPVAAG